MKSLFFTFALIILAISTSCTKDRFPTPDELDVGASHSDKELLYYWSFNNSSSMMNLITADVAQGDYELSYNAVWDDVSEGSEMNARNNFPAGSALRLRNPAGTFIIKVSTLGYKDIVMRYAVTRTNNGSQENIISYSIDGVNFYTLGLDNNTVPVEAVEYNLYTFDFSAVPSLNDQAEIFIQVEYNIGNTNSSGNNRVDNLTFEGNGI